MWTILIVISNMWANKTSKRSNCCVFWMINSSSLTLVYAELREACLLFSIYTTFISHRCQSSVLTCLTDTMGVFCCRVSLMCKALQMNSSKEEFWPQTQPVSPPSSQRSLSGSATGVIPPSFSKTMISLPVPGIRWLFEIPSTVLDWAQLLFPIDPEDGESWGKTKWPWWDTSSPLAWWELPSFDPSQPTS